MVPIISITGGVRHIGRTQYLVWCPEMLIPWPNFHHLPCTQCTNLEKRPKPTISPCSVIIDLGPAVVIDFFFIWPPKKMWFILQLPPNLSRYRFVPHTPRTTPPEPETRPKRARIGPDASKTAPLISRAGYWFAGPLRIWSGGVAGSVPTTHIDLLSTKTIPQEATSMIQHANLRAKSKHCRNLTKRQSHRAFYSRKQWESKKFAPVAG